MRGISAIALLLLQCLNVESTAIDMGTCACLCGDDGRDRGPVVTSHGLDSNFYNRIRGPQGSKGSAGKRGPSGPAGRPGPPGQKGDPGRSFDGNGSSQKPAESCFDIRQSGQTRSGIYTIQPTETSSIIQVYCDMESAGGGWTLVASIHENNIYGRCTLGDKWSSEQGNASKSYKGSGNWENYNTFGEPESATSDDYKSSAYFTLLASDVMVWHVPNDVDINQASSHATLKYYTDTGFLRDYGGTLQSLYSNHFPLSMSDRPDTIMEGITSVIVAFNRSSQAIQSLVPGFYRYVYDFDGSRQNYIKDGGQDMFDSGNKLYYQIDSYPETMVTYNVNYRNQSQGVDLLAATSHPFNAMMWIGNEKRTARTFKLKVVSGTGADGDGSYRTRSGTVTYGNLALSFHSYSVYSAGDPAISEVFYYVSNTVSWGSVAPAGFYKTPWSSGTDSLNHGVQVTGSPKSILMGYMLLSRASSSEVPETSIRNVLRKTLEIINGFDRIDEFNCSRLDDALVQPVIYLKGNNGQVMVGIPPIAKSSTTPGFIQFRSFSPKGIPNALCPAVKTETCRPQSVCIGGINSLHVEERSCGDFAGWAGLTEDLSGPYIPDESARSAAELKESILIFTRKQN